MCGVAGYSLSSRSSVDRTLAAQALLAGIADRGADAVGYAYRGGQDEYPVVTKQRTPASRLLDRITVPAHADELLIHVRDYTKGHPSIPANNHPVRHGPVVGIHNGIIVNDDELLAPLSCARAEPRMTVDSEAIFALAAHSRNDPRALEALAGSMATAWLDQRERGTGKSTRRRAERRTSDRPAIPSGATRPAGVPPPSPRTSAAVRAARRARRPGRPLARASPPPPARRNPPRAARS